MNPALILIGAGFFYRQGAEERRGNQTESSVFLCALRASAVSFPGTSARLEVPRPCMGGCGGAEGRIFIAGCVSQEGLWPRLHGYRA